MSDANEETAAAEGGDGSGSASSSPQNLGYCHICDRQVEIDPATFTCAVCHGGFIELFEGDANRPQAASQQQQQQPQEIRVDTARFLNNTGIASLLPLLLPQLLGQPGDANVMQSFSFGMQPPYSPQSGASTPSSHQTPDLNASPAPQQQQQQPTQRNTARLQFIVPGEPGGQFDLYGIINNVLSDVLAPHRHGAGARGLHGHSMPQNTQFHFQAPPIRMFQLHGDMRDYAWGAGGLDTIITQLLNQLENTGPPPATEQQLINLPVVKINQEEFDKKIECSICMEDFLLGEEAKKLPCKHYFHEPCITEWLKLHGTCPVCRKNLNGEDTSQREYISRPPPPGQASAETAAGGSAEQPAATQPPTETAAPAAETRTDTPNTNTQVYYDTDFD